MELICPLGYNFLSLEAIKPYLEPTGAGISAQWARATAARLECIVTVGYPEILSTEPKEKAFEGTTPPPSLYYNSTITVSPAGRTLAHYRKTHLYYTDETWAQESDTKWLTKSLPLDVHPPTDHTDGQNRHAMEAERVQDILTTFGICMDLNPRRFTAPWALYELATHTLSTEAQLLLLSMAWLTLLPGSQLVESALEPDLETLSYWVERLAPLVKNEAREVIVVFANRCGEEPGGVRYAGSSWVGKVGNGKIKIWSIAGRAEEKVLCVDTEEEPPWAFKSLNLGEGG